MVVVVEDMILLVGGAAVCYFRWQQLVVVFVIGRTMLIPFF